MARRLKLLTGLSALALSGALAASGCGGKSGEGEGEGEGAEGARAHHAAQTGEGEGKGQGQAGAEGEGEGAAAAAGDVASFVSQMTILRGHLKAGVALYAAGDPGAARVHMKHPHDELYVSLRPMFAAFGAPAPDAELNALAAAVEGGAALGEVEDKLARVSAAVDRAIAAAKPSVRDRLLAAAATLRTAGEEFDFAVKDGALVNAKEYQDAYGFLTTVVEQLGGVEGATPAEKDAVALAREQAAVALSAAPSAAPPAQVESQSSTIYGAAARVEIAALGLT
jgi:hypothetical protein